MYKQGTKIRKSNFNMHKTKKSKLACLFVLAYRNFMGFQCLVKLWGEKCNTLLWKNHFWSCSPAVCLFMEVSQVSTNSWIQKWYVRENPRKRAFYVSVLILWYGNLQEKRVKSILFMIKSKEYFILFYWNLFLMILQASKNGFKFFL
jgi:hypothetical protein